MGGDLVNEVLDRTLDIATENNGAEKEVCEASKAYGKVKLNKQKPDDEDTKLWLDRPVRKRKCVERLVLLVEADKNIRIEKGPGTKLKDIPNVANNLTRTKNENALKLLHSLLFSRRGKAAEIRRHILQFSGFVWLENEDKEKKKVRDKLGKCLKDRLVELSTILDLTVSSKKERKDDIIIKLMDFLEVPHATTSELISEKEQPSEGKRKRDATLSEQPFKKIKRIAIPSRKGLAQKMAAAIQNESGEVEEKEKGGDNAENGNVLEKQQPPAIIIYSRKATAAGKNNPAVATAYPCDRDIQEEINRLLQDADVGQVTYRDIITQIGNKFNIDPTPRKLSIKLMIQDQMTKLGYE